MSKQALLDMVPEDRYKVIYHEEDGKTYSETRQDVSGIIARAKQMMDNTRGRDLTRVALIPKAVLDRSFIEGWYHDQAAWRKWANDPANRDYRTWEGTI